jgi:hypothetical protein
MRKQVVLGMLAVLAGTTLASRSAAAQEQSSTSTQFSLGGGVDLPMGDFDDAANTGYHGLAAVTFTPATWPVGIQIDGNYGRFPDSSPADVNLQTIYGTGNIVYRFRTSSESTFRPYLIGGGGGAQTVPVTVKSLVFSEDPRAPHGHPHLHEHDHDHEHHHHHGHDHHHDHDHHHHDHDHDYTHAHSHEHGHYYLGKREIKK